MAFSDDEEKTAPQSVSNYYFVDDEDKPVDFSLLPIQWSGSESINGNKKLLFLNGTTDNGLQKIFKHVTAWKFDLRTVKPEISVLTKEGVWFKLQKPRKSFEELIRTTMITMQSLHFLKRNPEASAKSLWDHLYRVFSLYELRPSQNDLVDHMALISEAVKRDDSLANSKFLSKFLEEKPKKRKITDEDLPHQLTSGFIVDDMDDLLIDDVEDDESDDEDCFDSVCSFCDNGGELLCCEGRCLRSFHATVEAGEESVCESLGLTDKEVKTMENFFCDNCKYEQHQCFACGQLGSSSVSSGAEVFCCVSATCGYFYHPRCVARLLHLGDQADAEALEKRIVSGETFTCPIHKCCVCKQGEDKKVPELQFAVCRRCPKSYHRKCLPREIAFEDIEEDFIITRAWEGLLPNRILIYCLEHEIDDEIGTPIRDHLKFPVSEENKTVVRQSRRIIVEKKEKKESKVFISKEKAGLKKKNLASDDSPWDKTAAKAPKQLSLATHNSQTVKKGENVSARPCSMKKARISDASSKCLKNNMKSTVEKDRSLATDEDDTLGERLYTLINQGSEQVKLKRQDTADSELNKNANVKPTTKMLSSELPLLDANTERRLLALMKESESSITLEDVIKKHKVPSTHPHSSKNVVDKTITLGKVEASVEAARAALQKLLDGSSIEDAKAVCEPQILKQIFKWKEKLRVYLAPFLHGMRYTSFGRHFTKVEKLQEIVDKLHWYVQDGDMIVDFCCGANDFSCLMKKKLEETGKKCSYKNYDVIEPKNNFNFERRDWMTVKQGELLPGSKLIMGINPPFGVKAALANKFINKALEFNPKLLILIVPPETERLDKKKLPYELVWEDDQFLSGKAFYLPGSIDDGDKQMDQWNVKSPPLSLWSHCDWAAEHNEIAKKHHHLSMQFRGSLNLERNSYGDTSMLTGSGGGSDGTSMDDLLLQDKAEELREVQGSQGFWKNQPHETSRKRKCGEENSGRGVDKKHQLDEQYIVKSSQDGVMSNQYIELLDKQYGDDISRQYGGYLTEECKVHMRDGADGLAYRQYSEVGRESAMRSQIHLYGHGPDASGQGFYVLGSDLGHGHMVSTSYRHPGSTPESSYRMNESAKQRYAPRLDGLNHTRMNSLRSDLPLVGSNDAYDLWATQSGYRLDSIGFDPGSRPPFCHDNTPGWLND